MRERGRETARNAVRASCAASLLECVAREILAHGHLKAKARQTIERNGRELRHAARVDAPLNFFLADHDARVMELSLEHAIGFDRQSVPFVAQAVL